MNRIFSYDFLKLEFRDIYEDIEELRKKTTHDDIEKNINALIGDIIYYIYKKNSILYDEKIQWNKRLEMLKEINIIPSEILDMIILWSNKVKVNHSDIITAEDKISEMKILYEILAWFVVNYGEENYSLIVDNLIDSEKEIFTKYLPTSKSIPEKKASKVLENKVGDLE